MSNIDGSCLCGNIKLSIPKGKTLVLCHCLSCRKTSGTPASWNYVADPKEMQLTGETSVFEDIGESGNPTYRHFCGKCSSSIYTALSSPTPIFIKAGVFDPDDVESPPSAEIFCRNLEKWNEGYPKTDRKDAQ